MSDTLKIAISFRDVALPDSNVQKYKDEMAVSVDP